ncbi:hypothetical protein MKZ02_20150 [Pseudobacillus sp. FSL P4-0506]|uniref:hypothetical protein n=1 Tax=Pseudobacillus sp. FSL P4-0506 TaxID=2921576 RepID=UPI0030F78E27
MSEWLTIGQLIDQLKPNEIATDEKEEYTVSWKYGLTFVDEDKDTFKDIIPLYKERKWRIIPQYVSLEEAMKALKEGKVVTLYTTYTTHSFSTENYFRDFVEKSITIAEFVSGKWTIEK